jgi:hypothetical protein
MSRGKLWLVETVAVGQPAAKVKSKFIRQVPKRDY